MLFIMTSVNNCCQVLGGCAVAAVYWVLEMIAKITNKMHCDPPVLFFNLPPLPLRLFLHLLLYFSLCLFLILFFVHCSCRKARFSSVPSSTAFASVPSQRWGLGKDNFPCFCFHNIHALCPPSIQSLAPTVAVVVKSGEAATSGALFTL